MREIEEAKQTNTTKKNEREKQQHNKTKKYGLTVNKKGEKEGTTESNEVSVL